MSSSTPIGRPYIVTRRRRQAGLPSDPDAGDARSVLMAQMRAAREASGVVGWSPGLGRGGVEGKWQVTELNVRSLLRFSLCLSGRGGEVKGIGHDES